MSGLVHIIGKAWGKDLQLIFEYDAQPKMTGSVAAMGAITENQATQQPLQQEILAK